MYYHPLLLEHLAAYGIKGSEKKDYATLSNVVSKSRINNLSINKRYSYHSTCFIDKEKTIDICVYLSQLFVFEQYTKEEQWVMQHFILWPYDFISVTTIISLLKNDNIPDLEGVLLDLVDKVVFSKSSQGYRMHGLLAETLREKNLNYDYTVYVNNIKKLLYYPNRNNEFEKCFYNVDIVYNQWLENQPNNPLPKELLNNKGCRVVTILVKGVKFDMVRVNDYYMGETQVTQELWMAVMGDNPSLFSDKVMKEETSEYPIENVSWYDCLAFVMRLNEITGLKFSLPTEINGNVLLDGKKKEDIIYSAVVIRGMTCIDMRGLPQIPKIELIVFVLLIQMNSVFTICLAMCGSGVKIYMIRRVLRVCSVVARGTTTLTTAAYLTASASARTSGSTTTVCASPCLVRPFPV